MSEFFTRGTANIGDTITATLEEMKDDLQNIWGRNNVIIKKFKENMDEQKGGREIVVPIEYRDSNTVAFVNRSSTLSTTIRETLTQAGFRWAAIGGTYGIDDLEEAMNSGKHAFIKLLDHRLKNLLMEMEHSLEEAILASSTADADTPWSLYDIIDSADPTLANFGDIDRDSVSDWAAYEASSGAFSTQGLEDLRTALETVKTRGQGRTPGLHITTTTILNKYKARLTPFERLTSADKGDLEKKVLTFEGAPVVASYNAQSGTWLGVNLDVTKMVMNSALKFAPKPFVRTGGGLSRTAIVLTQLQMICMNPRLNFKLTSIS